MSRRKIVWVPALIMVVAALLFLAYYFFATPSHVGRGDGTLPSGGGMRPHGEGDDDTYGGYFTTIGTIAVFLGAASFSWLWFKKRRKSPSIWVRRAGQLFYSAHKVLGWAALLLIVAHGTFFLITKNNDDKIYTGLAGFTILLTIAAYGFFINKVRNKWMRTVHRVLGLLWVPILLLHAGGSAIAAVISTIAIGAIVMLLERMARQNEQPIHNR